MNRLMARIGLRVIGAGALLIAISFASAAPSAAASYTLSFTGTVTSATGIFSFFGTTPGDPISGAFKFDPLDNTPDATFFPGGDGYDFNQSAASFTFHTEHPGVFDFTRTDGGGSPNFIENASSVGHNPWFYFALSGLISNIDLYIETDAPGYAALTSLATLPTTADGLVALLTGSPTSAVGSYRVPGQGQVNFQLTLAPAVVVAATPIPATLPLFGAGLAMLGFAARRRRAA